MRKVLIGIQARSDSSRLPGKVRMTIENKPILDWVIEACKGVIRYMKKDRETLSAEVSYMLLVPKGDPLVANYQNSCQVYEGSKDDVLSRYVETAEKENADYIVRVTGDCQAIPTHIISKHIKSALIRGRDYTTNTMVRTFREGFDTQVFSRRLLKWMDENAKDASDREHVGTILDKLKFPYIDSEGRPNICHVLSDFYEADIKTSIDNQEDLEKARIREGLLRDARNRARRGGICVS